MSLKPTFHAKIAPRHLERLAIIYVRQSTIQQVQRHQESTKIQYGLVERARALGWSADRIHIIDEDLGRSASSAEGRPGFQKLVAEVSLDHVGIILGVEMSRLARSCRDWYQLLEVCSIFGALLADLDGVYDPSTHNDRLLLGLKGTMSEAELYVIKQRMLSGKLEKAKRGELGMAVPMGYCRRPSGEIIKDPDEEAQAVISLVFKSFERLGTIDGVLRSLVRSGIKMPKRIRSGIGKGELEWVRPVRMTLSNMLHHPIYAGAYVYGRRSMDSRRQIPGRPSTGRQPPKFGRWQVCLKDQLPSYIDWDQFEKNHRQLEANMNAAAGTPRNGPSLLSGILFCGHCGLRLYSSYTNNGGNLRYQCARARTDYGEDLCQSLKGTPLDELLADLVLRALEPAALEVSLRVAEDVEAERRKAREIWEKRLERARYAVERAFRQYDAVDPENRLVARNLERRWEEALSEEQRLQEDFDRFRASQALPLSREERERIVNLGREIPELWQAPTTTCADRQAIVRLLVEKVTVSVQGESEKVEVEVGWQGGHLTRAILVRPVARLEQLSYYQDLLSRVAALHSEGKSRIATAKQLNREGWRPAKRRDTFNSTMVGDLLQRQGLTKPQKGRLQNAPKKEADEWTISELSCELGMPAITLYDWLRRGLVVGRRASIRPGTPWLIVADKKEIKRLRELRAKPKRWAKLVRTQETGK